MQDENEIRVLVADDHPAIRHGMVDVVNARPGLKVVAEAGSAEEVLAAAREHALDLAVLDLGMPGATGTSLVRALREAYPKLGILVFSQHREEDVGIACLKAGANGYLNKSAAVEEIGVALTTVAQGRRYLSPALAELLVAGAPQPGDRPPHEMLSAREREVLHGLAHGRRLAEIAETLGINVKTVHTYRTRVLNKLGVRTNVELVLYAVEHRLLGWPAERAGQSGHG